MAPADIELARQLVAHPRWEWRPGMLPLSPDSDEHGEHFAGPRLCDYQPEGMAVDDSDLPDLHDDATAGVLLGMLPGPVAVHRIEDRTHVVFDGADGRRASTRACAHLGVACAKALLELW